MQLTELVRYLDGYLQTAKFRDASLNGLQVEGRDEVKTIALAVDASLQAIEAAIAGDADLLLTHHGLFWGNAQPLVGWLGRRIKRLMGADCSLYTSHLPLDAHGEVGNNAQLLKLLGWEMVQPFGDYRGQMLGFIGQLTTPLSIEGLVSHIKTTLAIPENEIKVWGQTPRGIRRVGVLSGDGASELEQALREGCDALLTGETNYAAVFPSIEADIPLICAGHYHTETLGVKALGAHLEQTFRVKTFFVDVPTGV